MKKNANERLRTRESANALRAIALAGVTAVGGGVVVVQEDLLERWLAARHRRHRIVSQRCDKRPHAAAHLEAKRVRARACDVDSGQAVELGRGPLEGDLDRLGAQVAQLLERALVDEAPRSEDADPVAQRLDLAQDVRGEEDGLTSPLRLLHRLAK